MKEEKSYLEAGWTFIETIIVIAIIMVLTSSVGFLAIQYVDKARVATAKTQIDSFSIALEAYYLDCGKYPDQSEGLEVLWKQNTLSNSASNWNGPYLYKSIPNDPWGNPYVYRVPGGNGMPFVIISYGADGKEGGGKYDADISSN